MTIRKINLNFSLIRAILLLPARIHKVNGESLKEDLIINNLSLRLV